MVSFILKEYFYRRGAENAEVMEDRMERDRFGYPKALRPLRLCGKNRPAGTGTYRSSESSSAAISVPMVSRVSSPMLDRRKVCPFSFP